MTNILDCPLQVSVINCVDEVDDPEFVNSVMEQIRTKVQNHLEYSPEYFKNANLTIKLRKCMARFYLYEVRWNIWVETSGTINQKKFRFVSQSEGAKYESRERISLTTSWFVSNLINSLRRTFSKDYSYETDYELADKTGYTRNALSTVIEKLLNSIETTINRPTGATSHLWKKWVWARWLVTIPAFFLFSFCCYFVEKKYYPQEIKHDSDLIWFAVGGCMMSLALFWFIHSLGYLLMPADFYRKETAGLNALRKAGTDNILVVRIVALTIMSAILFGFFFVWYAIIYHESPF